MGGKTGAVTGSVPAGRIEIQTGLEALAQLERALCGEVASDPAIAEGRALAGVRAASQAPARRLLGTGMVTLREASCVHHVRGVPPLGHGDAFELIAESAQDAVDQCAVAHLLSRGLARPGICSVPISVADGLSATRMPKPTSIVALLERAGAPAEADATTELAERAFADVSELTGRPAQVARRSGADNASLIIVGAGTDAACARELAKSLTARGVPTGAVSVKLLRPLPEQRIREALDGARSVFVLEDRARRGALLGSLRALVDEKTEVHELRPANIAALLAEIAERLPPESIDLDLVDAPPQPLTRRLICAPGGSWSRSNMRRALEAMGRVGSVRVAAHARSHLGSSVLSWECNVLPAGRRDLLLASHVGALDPRGALALTRPGAAVVVLAEASSSRDLGQQLPPAARALARSRKLRLHWVSAPDADALGSERDAERAAGFALVGAALVALFGPRSSAGTRAVDSVVRDLIAEGQRAEADWLRTGARQVRELKAADLDPALHAEEVDFRRPKKLPRMPDQIGPRESEQERERWRERVLHFHRTGSAGPGPAPGLPLEPAVLRATAVGWRESSFHPFALVRTDDPSAPLTARPLRELLDEAAGSLDSNPVPGGALSRHVERLTLTAARELESRSGPAALGPLLEQANERLIAEISPAKEDRAALADALARLREKLPDEAVALKLCPDTPLRLYMAAIEAVRGPVRARFLQQLRQLAEGLSNLLLLDHADSDESRSPDALRSAIGSSGARHFDPEALAQTLPVRSGSATLGEERRFRVERALETIERQLEKLDELPDTIFVKAPGVAPPTGSARHHEHADPFAAAIGIFDGTAARLAAVFRAARIARLEVAGAYRSELHDRALVDLGWDSLTPEELAVLPVVTVIAHRSELGATERGSLSDLLRSCRPVHVIIEESSAVATRGDDLEKFHLDLGALIVAHREAFALRSTLARPARLVRGLVRMAQAIRPAVALLQSPDTGRGFGRALMVEAALQGRVSPDFRYDPEAGRSWADRFEIEGNPEPDRAWPSSSLAYLDHRAESSMELAFTFGDAAALDPAYRQHFYVPAAAAWDDETQVRLADWLEQADPTAVDARVPYIWVVDSEGMLHRAMLTRELAMACGDRLRSWRVLQELAGYQNTFVERARVTARAETLAEAEQRGEEREREHLADLERVRSEVAEESMERLAAVLLNSDGIALAAPPLPAPLADAAPAAVAAPVAPTPVEEPAVSAPEAAPDEDEDDDAFGEPFIDSAMCTTCNECTNINSRLFQYDADKQAFIADAAAGSFEELVKSAELCPASCIHPGKPRSGDATVTPDLVERASAFA